MSRRRGQRSASALRGEKNLLSRSGFLHCFGSAQFTGDYHTGDGVFIPMLNSGVGMLGLFAMGSAGGFCFCIWLGIAANSGPLLKGCRRWLESSRIHDVVRVEAVLDGCNCFHTQRGNVGGEPRQVFGANGMVVRESGAAVDERLLGGTLDVQILLHFATLLLHETKCEIKTRSAAIGVADMAAGPGWRPAF